MNQRSYRVAVLGGDGIGPEVTSAALEVVNAAGVNIATDVYKRQPLKTARSRSGRSGWPTSS